VATKLETFLDAFQSAIDNQNAAVFVGAGLSKPSGFVDWKELLRDIAKELDLDVDIETDLIALAQYHENHSRGRGRINQTLIDEFTKDAAPTRNHELLAALPISTFWTTNYDRLIEEALIAAHKRIDVKMSRENLAISIPKRDAVVYKMHGDVSRPDEAVLTKQDYETYNEKRQLFSMQLQGDLISKTFLFLGFSFTDPNIDYILGRIRALVGQNRRDHYCLMKRPTKPAKTSGKKGKAELARYNYESKKFEHRTEDLKVYGINTVALDDYGEITTILERLVRTTRRKNIFVSGSADDFAPLGQPRLDLLGRALGAGIIAKGYNLVTGIGLGVGGSVLVGAMDSLYAKPVSHLDERTVLRPFPQEHPTHGSRDDLWKRYRREMIGKAGFAVFLSGNKLVGGSVVTADGVEKEFDIAVEFGVTPIPIGATGHAARDLWTRVSGDLKKFYGGSAQKISKDFNMLNSNTASNDELLAAVFNITATLSRT